MSRPRVVLVGPPGAGKSTVGKLLAEHWDVPFRDTDADIEATAGTSIAEIFYDHGEPHFRALEVEAVQRALVEHEGVLSLGGGAVVNAAVRDALAGHDVVLLDIGLSAAAHRTGLSRDRPVLALNPRAQLRALLAERRPHYIAVAVHVVPTDDRTPIEVVEEIVRLIGPSS